VSAEGLNLFSLLLGCPSGPTVGPILETLLFSPHRFEAHLFDVFTVLAHSLCVFIDLVGHILNYKSVGILLVAVEVVSKLL
jgi:hypothetical protein